VRNKRKKLHPLIPTFKEVCDTTQDQKPARKSSGAKIWASSTYVFSNTHRLRKSSAVIREGKKKSKERKSFIMRAVKSGLACKETRPLKGKFQAGGAPREKKKKTKEERGKTEIRFDRVSRRPSVTGRSQKGKSHTFGGKKKQGHEVKSSQKRG